MIKLISPFQAELSRYFFPSLPLAAKLNRLLTCFAQHVSHFALCHCKVCAEVAGAADGADVSVNALHVCRDAAFLNPPTYCLLRQTVPAALCSFQTPHKGKAKLNFFSLYTGNKYIQREKFAQSYPKIFFM